MPRGLSFCNQRPIQRLHLLGLLGYYSFSPGNAGFSPGFAMDLPWIYRDLLRICRDSPTLKARPLMWSFQRNVQFPLYQQVTAASHALCRPIPRVGLPTISARKAEEADRICTGIASRACQLSGGFYPILHKATAVHGSEAPRLRRREYDPVTTATCLRRNRPAARSASTITGASPAAGFPKDHPK